MQVLRRPARGLRDVLEDVLGLVVEAGYRRVRQRALELVLERVEGRAAQPGDQLLAAIREVVVLTPCCIEPCERRPDRHDGQLDGLGRQPAGPAEHGGHQPDGGGDVLRDGAGHERGILLESRVLRQRARSSWPSHARGAARLPAYPGGHDIDPICHVAGTCPARPAAGLLRRRRPGRADGREGSRPVRRPGLRPQADRAQRPRRAHPRGPRRGLRRGDRRRARGRDRRVLRPRRGADGARRGRRPWAEDDRCDLPARDEGAPRGEAVRGRRPRHRADRARGSRGGRRYDGPGARAHPPRRRDRGGGRRRRSATPPRSPTCRRPRCPSTRPT